MNENLSLARSFYYEFFAIPFFFSENDTKFKLFKEQLRYLATSPLQESDRASFEALEEFSFESFKKEQNLVLFDYSFSNVPLTASFYAEGRDDGKARILVLETLRKSKFRRNDKVCKDSEDFIGFIFYAMSSLLKDEVGQNNFLSTELFVNVINGFVDELSELMKENKGSVFYAQLANLMSSFFAFERAFLGVKTPIFEKSVAKEAMQKAPYISKFGESKDKYEWSDELSKYQEEL
ncbi:molecular chaperone TorD family protein [Campylobacter geochelonis]|uniref:Putative formate dehydrogenase-specific chaperone n=1 Tax=Campylobacter geochelonis TaxID=1780362 RepID=A0A128EA40_9BACT|nr:molecular chaperone TorD family protein [Campylobacter geochelonis]QKF72062.1 putative formate dehydrogenase-specific chaperone [Campylobacter geochelonis]CZE45825.1 Putative formate dehydrogenase-specific chaperone [Campylobacter geochelonis]CZE46808.1 Putative formate dehydrogenase-specific chaperone [Campylobacter geochelonis]CZE49850.1 Putative formate dehydrogenase-specific chaperone [Campylobacter geochelonis]